MDETRDIVERLRDKTPGRICPYDRRSPDYWSTPDDVRCPVCGGTEDVDLCRGLDLSVMDEAASEIERLRSDLTRSREAHGELLESLTTVERTRTSILEEYALCRRLLVERTEDLSALRSRIVGAEKDYRARAYSRASMGERVAFGEAADALSNLVKDAGGEG